MKAIKKEPGKAPVIIDIEEPWQALGLTADDPLAVQQLATDVMIIHLPDAKEENFLALGMDFRGTVLVIGIDGDQLVDVPKMDMLLWALFRVVRYGRADRKNNVWNCRHCGHLEQFEADGPFENGWNICPVCGGWIQKPTDQ